MAGRPSESINWDGLGNEADEDASEMNYEYEWVVPDHGMSNWINSFSRIRSVTPKLIVLCCHHR